MTHNPSFDYELGATLEFPRGPIVPERWTLSINPECLLTRQDWIHLRTIEASGSLDFWRDPEEDIYD